MILAAFWWNLLWPIQFVAGAKMVASLRNCIPGAIGNNLFWF
jgi:hypothetical protein